MAYDLNSEIQKTIKMQEIKDRLDKTSNMCEVGSLVDALTEEEAKKLLRLYIYDR